MRKQQDSFMWLETGTEIMEMELIAVVLVTALALLTAFPPVIAGPGTNEEVLFQNCSSDGHVEGSNLGRNVKLVVESLAKNTPSTGFNTSSRGNNGNRVYGMMQCRGDLQPWECARCASLISSKVLQSCTNTTSALIQLQGCFLRYTTDNSLWEEGQGLKLLCTPRNGTRGPSRKDFAETVRKLLYQVSIRAADNEGFWTESVGSPGAKIYGLAQCWGDLSRTACGSCLTFASSCAMRCPNGAPGAQYLTQNCFVRFDTATFYDNSNYTSAPPVGKKRIAGRGLILIILGAVLGTALAVVCRIMCKRASKPNISVAQKYEGIFVK